MWPSVQAAFALLNYLGSNPFKGWTNTVPYAETLDYTWADHHAHGGAWAKAYHQAELAVKDMTLDEKVLTFTLSWTCAPSHCHMLTGHRST